MQEIDRQKLRVESLQQHIDNYQKMGGREEQPP